MRAVAVQSKEGKALLCLMLPKLHFALLAAKTRC